MARRQGGSSGASASANEPLPIQPVPRAILCNPYEEPTAHWHYDKDTGAATELNGRREASYWYKTERTGSAQLQLATFAEETRDDLKVVNLLREDVRRWRGSDYRNATPVTRDLLHHWRRQDRFRRLFFCQLEAVETILYLNEIRLQGKRLQYNPHLSEENLQRLLRGERASFTLLTQDWYERLVDTPSDPDMTGLRRIACKMATGSGKTVVMSMLIAWAFCNRGTNPASRFFPGGVLVCCPNLTVKERLQVLRPEIKNNYYDEFDIVPIKYRPLMQAGRVLVTNWHLFAPESEHVEAGKSFAVVNKGPETPDTFARRVLGDLYERMPLMVLNDEGHHCWRPAPAPVEPVGEEESQDAEEARVWLNGLDWINNSTPDPKIEPGISLCVDLSATPFYLKGSGHAEGTPFPWIVSDFGLVDAIESGIVKIPRLPVQDNTGPDPKYFRLWRAITENLPANKRHPGKGRRPKADAVYEECEGALRQIAGVWKEKFETNAEAKPGQEFLPPVLILVCDNTDIAEVFYRNISGETEQEIVTATEVDEVLGDGDGSEEEIPKRKTKPKKKVLFGKGHIFPELLSNTPTERRTLRIDSKLLAEAESEDPKKRKPEAAEALRQIVATVGKKGEPGASIRCVVSVSMLTEGWDANNVTQILGVRAFGSQLLCEQVVGRGLRRMDYVPDPETGLLTEEYVDVYGIPFSVIPYKGRPENGPQPDDRPKNHVRALAERAAFAVEFPVVEGYAFALRKNAVLCDVKRLERLALEPNREPTATFVRPTVGYSEGSSSSVAAPFEFLVQDRKQYYDSVHEQTIKFWIARLVVDDLATLPDGNDPKRARVLRLQSRHQLFPQIYRIVEEFVDTRVDWNGCDHRELGLQKYVQRVVERVRDGIVPDESEGEPPLMPVLNRYQPKGNTTGVNFKTTRACHATVKSHIDQVVMDTQTWEATAAFRLEESSSVAFFARNDHMGFSIPYDFDRGDHGYEPDFLVRLKDGNTVVLEIKGEEDERDRAKHSAARKWVTAVNNWGKLGKWEFMVCRNPQILGEQLAKLSEGT